MKIRDIVLMAIINIKSQKKQFIIYSVIITLLFLIATIAIQIPYNIKDFMHTMIYGDISGRELLVTKFDSDVKDTIDELNSTEHIVYAYNDSYNAIHGDIKFNDNLESGTVKIIPVNDKFSPLIVKGRKIMNKGEIICPIEYASSDKKSKSELISLHDYLNKDVEILYYQPVLTSVNGNVNISLNGFTKKVKLVGLYANALSMTSSNECYMLDDELMEMTEKSEALFSGETDGSFNQEIASHVIVDNPDNIDIVIEDLTQKGYQYVERVIEFDFNLIKTINFTSYAVLCILLIIIFLILITYIKKIVIKQRTNISLYKMLGYTSKNIVSITMTELFLILMVGFISSIIVYLIGITIFNLITDNLLYNLLAICKLKLSITYELLLFVSVSLFLYFAAKVNLSAINKLEIKEILDYDNNI